MTDVRKDSDSLRDKCGVVGVFGSSEAAHLVYLALHAIQHRGQDSAGIVSNHRGNFIREVGPGLVSDVFNQENLRKLCGSVAIGHVRYTTCGSSGMEDAQPLTAKTGNGQIAIAHNGNLVNEDFLRSNLKDSGAIFHGSSDTELISHLFALSRQNDAISCLRDALEKVKGAYSLAMMIENKLVGIRDPHGIRPLFLGQADDAYVLSSEDCAFTLINAKTIREIEPGEIIVIDHEGVKSFPLIDKDPKRVAPCIFEHVYFSRPDSHVFERSVYKTRKALGRELAKEAPADVDAVIAVPDSGVLSAMGYSEQLAIPYDFGLVRNHYVGRTFIEPKDKIRHFGVRLKLSPVKEVVNNKRLVVVDDSIVRGTTSKKIVELIRSAGAREIHMRIAAPMTKFPCRYGIATPTKEELVASKKSLPEIESFLKVDSLAYLSQAGMYRALFADKPHKKMCDACFSGNYPI